MATTISGGWRYRGRTRDRDVTGRAVRERGIQLEWCIARRDRVVPDRHVEPGQRRQDAREHRVLRPPVAELPVGRGGQRVAKREPTEDDDDRDHGRRRPSSRVTHARRQARPQTHDANAGHGRDGHERERARRGRRKCERDDHRADDELNERPRRRRTVQRARSRPRVPRWRSLDKHCPTV